MSGPEAGKQLRIVTLTLNPAVDIACRVAAIQSTHKMRTTGERYDPGGGGINVARVLLALGTPALALIMAGGVTGKLIQELLDEDGVRWQCLPINGRTRINQNVHDDATALEYRFVAAGPRISEAEWRHVLVVLGSVEAEWVVASGSLPLGVPSGFYGEAAAIALRRGQKFVLDSSGPALREAIGRGIELLKLSLSELEFLVGVKLAEPERREAEVVALQRSGAARMIAVSLGRDGALLATSSGLIRLGALPVQEQSAVGAGDSFLAGLVLGLARGLPERSALALAISAGSAAVMSYGTALVRREEVEIMFRQLTLDATPLQTPPV